MGLIDEFEKRVERVVEGAFSKAFRSKVEPSEIGRRLMREMESGKSVSVGAVYVPNRFTIALSPADHERFEGLLPALRKEFLDLLKAHAADRNWRPAGALEVGFVQSERLAEGKFEVDAAHEAGAEPTDTGPESNGSAAKDRLVLVGTQRSWDLEPIPGFIAGLGRAPGNLIVLTDPNASRNHAEITWREGSFWLSDLGSTNGTLVNDNLVMETRLGEGDEIKIGTSVLRYEQGSGS